MTFCIDRYGLGVGKILVTGGSGFIGRQVTNELRQMGHTPFVVARNPNSLDSGVEVRHTEDLFSADKEELTRLLDGMDSVVHLAWHVDPFDYMHSDANWRCLIGSVNLALVSREMEIEHFTGIGTCLEYDQRHSVCSPTTPLEPDSIYGAAKTSQLYALKGVFHGSKTALAWARPFFIYGEGENPERLVPHIRSQISQGSFPSLRSPTAIRDYLDVAEVGRRIAKIADLRLTGVHNICSGKPISVFELARGIALEMGREDLVEEGEASRLESDNQKHDEIVGLPSAEIDRHLDS